MKAPERRKFMRLKASLGICFKLLTNQSLKVNCKLHDLSREGIQLITNHKVNSGDMITLDVEIPGDSKIISAVAQVLWLVPNESSSFKIGLRFVQISDSDRAKLIEHVYNELLSRR